jgi:succinate dehydrogenase/fumarate reductase cytochrome b subunit
LESFLELLFWILIEFFGDKILVPIFQHIGAGIKYIFLHKKYTFKEILKNGNNGTLAVVVLFFSTIIIIALIYSQ